uniref:Uncharacterized protein n=1 Tax=Oryza sativa subsp. japonica TaxID=39947 RepID=Q6K9N8_ORYSJ|nr:hypothetical protein [Oryza sativa Japonica Group]
MIKTKQGTSKHQRRRRQQGRKTKQQWSHWWSPLAMILATEPMTKIRLKWEESKGNELSGLARGVKASSRKEESIIDDEKGIEEEKEEGHLN